MIVALILCIFTSIGVAEDRPQIVEADHFVIQTLIERETDGVKIAKLMDLELKLQAFLINSSDRRFVDDLVKGQEAYFNQLLKDQKAGRRLNEDSEEEKNLLNLLVALRLRLKVSGSTGKKDVASFSGTVGGIDVATCHGPIRTGSVSVNGVGKVSSAVASRMLERAKEQRDEEFDRAMTAQANCRRPPCYGVRPGSCCGAAAGTGAARMPYCNCPEHRAAVLKLYGPAADPARYPCKCQQPCPGCAGNMVYLSR